MQQLPLKIIAMTGKQNSTQLGPTMLLQRVLTGALNQTQVKATNVETNGKPQQTLMHCCLVLGIVRITERLLRSKRGCAHLPLLPST